MAEFEKVFRGERLNIPAKTWNALIDVARDANSRTGDTGDGPIEFDRGGGIVNIKNNSSTNLDQFAILGISGLAFTKTDNELEFKRHPTLTGTIPSTASHVGKFVILCDPLPIGAIGRAFAYGVCPVLINMTNTSSKYADISPADTAKLKSADSGGAQILWVESGTGNKWAAIRFVSSPARVWAIVKANGVDGDGNSKYDAYDMNDTGYVTKINLAGALVPYNSRPRFPDGTPLLYTAAPDGSVCNVFIDNSTNNAMQIFNLPEKLCLTSGSGAPSVTVT